MSQDKVNKIKNKTLGTLYDMRDAKTCGMIEENKALGIRKFAKPIGVIANPATQMHLSILIVLVFCAQSLVQTLQFSDNAEAAWVFGALPEVRPRLLQLGAQKALVVRVLSPLHVGLVALTTVMMPAADGILHVLNLLLTETSICGLGYVALNPLLSVAKHWPEEVPGAAQGGES